MLETLAISTGIAGALVFLVARVRRISFGEALALVGDKAAVALVVVLGILALAYTFVIRM